MKKILTINHYPQTTEYTCGPATLLTFLNYHDQKLCRKLTEKRLIKLLKTCPSIGTTPFNLYRELKQTGPNFTLIKNAEIISLEAAINEERPAIVLWFYVDDWHWSTTIGYDTENLIFLNPYTQDGYHQIRKKDFESYWSKLAIK